MKSKLSVSAAIVCVFISSCLFNSPSVIAYAPKIPIKSGIGIALDAYKMSQEELRKGAIFQKYEDYNNAALCYIRSVQLWSDEKVYYNLSFCFLMLGRYMLAERTALAGLAQIEEIYENKEYFMGLLGDIYYSSGNLRKSLAAYEKVIALTNSCDISLLVIKRIKEIKESLGID